MKKILSMIVLISSVHAFAGANILEFDQAEEVKCYNEAKSLGCLNSSGEEDQTCVETQKAQLSKLCLSMHSDKMKN